MKKFIKFSIAVFGGILVLVSCQNVNMNDMMVTPSTVDVTYDPFTYDFDSGPTPIRIAVNAGHDWFVQSTAEWITIDDTTITATGFTLTLDKYIGEGPDTRSGIVLVSSQIGQWPVVVNQDRIQYSTLEEWAGTYRVQYKAFTEDPVGKRTVPLVEQDLSWDFLVDVNISASGMTFGSFFPYETEKYPNLGNIPFVSSFDKEKGCMVTSGIGGYALSAILCHHYPEEGGFYSGTGWKYTIDPKTKQLTLPSVKEGHSVYFQPALFMAVFMGDYYYGDFTITQIEQQLPAGAPEQDQPFQGDIKLKDGGIFNGESDFLTLM